MKTNDFPAPLQSVVRKYYQTTSRKELGKKLNLTPRAVSFNLAGRRPMTFDFLGRIALFCPRDWKEISNTPINIPVAGE
jgi:hypothetical protein